MSNGRHYKVVDAETVEALERVINRFAQDYRAINISSYLVNTPEGSLEYQLMALLEYMPPQP